jgi:1-acyl-sn-glycerol-3-phosphate acyltransferase
MQSLLSKNKLPKNLILLQRIIGLGLFCLLYIGYWTFLFVIKRYKIPNIKEIRKQFKSIVQSHSGPLLICPNHLTYIDSVLLIVAFSSCKDYLLNFHTMAWNFPKTTHIKNNYFYQFVSYIGKCIFINLEATHEKINQPMAIAKYLLSKGEYIMLFPEGHRSYNGKVDLLNFTYGVGRLINDTANLKILCVYVRGSTQHTSSNYPNKYDSFYVKLQLVDPIKLKDSLHTSNNSELRNIRNIAHSIVSILSELEKQYFEITYNYLA